MARNGSGTFSLPQAPFVTNTTISSTATNSNNSDIAAALTQSISKDGQTTYTGNQPMGGNKLTGLGVGTAVADSAAMSQLYGVPTYGGVGGGTVDAITITPSPGITAYAIGQKFSFKSSGANTGAVTLNVNSVGAGAVVGTDGSALAAGDIQSGRMVAVEVVAATPIFQITSQASTAVTQAVGNSSTKVATTAFVQAATAKVYIQTFTGSGTYTPHAGMVNCIIECLGGGGGGGGTATTSGLIARCGGGGGGGGMSTLLATAATIGASQTVTIGAAGSAGSAGNNAGGAGGDTSVGSLCIGKGGSGGAGSDGLNSSSSAGGAGGVAGTGTLTPPGWPGLNGNAGNSSVGMATMGGSSPYGAGGIGTTSTTNVAGVAGTGRGSGGSGGFSFNIGGTAAGAAGTAGYVVIYEFCNQ